MAKIIKGEKHISRSEAAKIAGVSRSEIDVWIKTGPPRFVNLKLRVIRLGRSPHRRIYIKEAVFEEFLADKRAGDAAADALTKSAPMTMQKQRTVANRFRRATTIARY